MKYTEEYLLSKANPELKEIIKQLAQERNCKAVDICPKGARRELLIESILETQEEAGGS